MSTDPEPTADAIEPSDETIHIGWLPVGTRIRWTDGAGRRPHEGVLVPWPDRPPHTDGVRVIETVISEIPHVLPESRHVNVVYVAEDYEG